MCTTINGGLKVANICDYIKWRGDITLEESEFNEIDNLVLSRLSYFPFDELIEKNEEATIEELSNRFINADKSTMKILWPDDNELFPLLGQSKRFKDMIVTRGGKCIESVSSKTDVVIVGENPGSKYDKAKTLGITIWSEEEFLEKLRKGNE